MYCAHFGLQELPFSITPDPGYLYLSEYHREALAHLVYGMDENGGFVQLTGEVGTGKTTLIRALLAQTRADVQIALCLNPQLSVREFVALILDELGIAYPQDCESLKILVDLLNQYLLASHARGARTVVIIDEAQNLGRNVLEQIRLLTNLETNRHKLLRIILVGQPELRENLARQDLRQLAQRITARYHLLALDREQTAAYVRHRLQVAGAKKDLFSRNAIAAVFRHARGVPRLINIICDRALLGAYVSHQASVNSRVVKKAAAEVFAGGHSSVQSTRLIARSGVWASAMLAAAIGLLPGNIIEFNEAHSIDAVEAADSAAIIEPTSEPGSSSSTAPESASPPPQPPIDDLGGFLATLKTHDSALRRLLALWHIDLSNNIGGQIDSSLLCSRLEIKHFRCLSDSGDWATLKQYNRPAIITLVESSGDTLEILLENLDEDKAVLAHEQQQIVVNLAQLDPLWTGKFFLIWQTPPHDDLIGPGSTGAEVIWLRRQLAQLAKRPLEEPLSAEFDDTLLAQVKDFQRQYNLAVDGLAGAQTIKLLHQLAPAPPVPLLVRSSEKRQESG